MPDISIDFYFTIEPYHQGEVGIDSCPEGYQPITDPSECETASQNLGLLHRGDLNTGHADAICALCGACADANGGKSTRLYEEHGDHARWICKLSGKYVPQIKFH